MTTVYETMYILRPDLGDEQVVQQIAKYENLIREHGAENIEIQRHRDGVYIQLNYTGPGTVIAIMERAMRLSEEVIRYMTAKQEVHQEKPAEEVVAA